jgi:hypothetical protein
LGHVPQKICAAFVKPETKLGGIAELDESWIGGKIDAFALGP